MEKITKIEHEKIWFFEEKGQRKGAFSEEEMIHLIKSGQVIHDTLVWKSGFPEWLEVQNTILSSHFDQSVPPPLTGTRVNNTFVWILAFAPIIGVFLEGIVAYLIYKNNYLVESALNQRKYWYITLILNVALAFWDESILKKAGHHTQRFNGLVWLAPVYLFQRAKALKQHPAYFYVWLGCFVVVIFA